MFVMRPTHYPICGTARHCCCGRGECQAVPDTQSAVVMSTLPDRAAGSVLHEHGADIKRYMTN